MGQTSKNKPATAAKKITVENNIPQVIYADRIINAGFSSSVSRLTLGVETGHETYTQSATLILPTPALLDAMSQILQGINENVDLREGIIQSLDAFKEKLISVK